VFPYRYRATLASVRRLAALCIELQNQDDPDQNWEMRGPLLQHLEMNMTAGRRLLRLAVNPWWTASLMPWWTPTDGRIYRALGRADPNLASIRQ